MRWLRWSCIDTTSEKWIIKEKKCEKLLYIKIKAFTPQKTLLKDCGRLEGTNFKHISHEVPIWLCLDIDGTFLVSQTVNNPPAIQETRIRSLDWEDLLEKGMTTHSSILAWRTPWTEEPGGGLKEWDMTE